MAAITWIASTDRIVGSNHPLFADTINSPIIQFNTNFLVEHTQAGRHDAQSYALVGEIGTYAGTGSGSKTVTLSNANLQPKFVTVWYNAANWTLEKIDTIAGADGFFRGSTAVVLGFADMTVSTGQFISEFNLAATTYYYMVLGIDTTSTYTGTPASGSDPTWITSSTSNTINANGTATVSSANNANNVASEINTIFGIAHNTSTGVHTTNPYAGYGKIETGTYAGNGGGDRVITLSDTTLDIQFIGMLLEIPSTSTSFYGKTESMTANEAKAEGSAAFLTNVFNSVGTGTFSAQAALNTSGRNYYWYAIGV